MLKRRSRACSRNIEKGENHRTIVYPSALITSLHNSTQRDYSSTVIARCQVCFRSRLTDEDHQEPEE